MKLLNRRPNRPFFIIFGSIVFLLLIGITTLILKQSLASIFAEKRAIYLATEFLQDQGIKNIEEYPVSVSETEEHWAVFF